MATDDTVAIINDLQAQIDALRAELARLQPAPSAVPDETLAPATANRRNLLKLAGAAAVGTVASTALASRAAAETGYTTGGSTAVADTVLQVQNGLRTGKTGFVFSTVSNPSSQTFSNYPGALGGWAFDIDTPNGVYGFSSVSNGRGVVGSTIGGGATGVFGVSTGTNGVGVGGQGPSSGVSGTTTTADGKGVFGTSNVAGAVGVQGSAVTTGVAGYAGTANNAVGVHGSGTGDNARGGGFSASGTGSIGVIAGANGTGGIGLDAQGTMDGVRGLGATHGVWGRSEAMFGVGVRGTAGGAAETGVFGNGGHYAVSGSTENANGIGGGFYGLAGALQVGYGEPAAPSARARAHEARLIECDAAGNVWYCYEAGTPGKWVKLAGPATAGAFHPLSPGRVYDSREPQPSPGALAGGNNRTISVADRRAVSGGSVEQANFVPAGAIAVAANITLVSQSGAGFLSINPGGDTTVKASTINWSAPGQILANGVILTLDANRQITVIAGGGSTDFLVDITGYWL